MDERSIFAGGHLSPVAVVHADRLGHNVDLMARYCAAHDVLLAPHNKTALSREVARLQVDAGAWALTVASASQADTVRSWGFDRILIANEVVDRAGLARIAAVVRGTARANEMYVYVDSHGGLDLLARALQEVPAGGPRLNVLLEIGGAGSRGGLRHDADALDLARSIALSPALRLVGVATYEGLIGTDRVAESIDEVTALVDRGCRLGLVLAALGLLPEERIITAGGSLFFDEVRRAFDASGARGDGFAMVLRSGCYAFHDHGMFAGRSPLDLVGAGERLVAAIEVWGSVLSMPEPGLAICDIGRRDVGTDAGLPVSIGLRSRDGDLKAPGPVVTFTGLNDQHGYLEVPAGVDVSIGDRVGFGISHPCSTLDRWRSMPLVDDAYVVAGSLSMDL